MSASSGRTTSGRSATRSPRRARPAAPWYVVPADRKGYRDWAILTILTRTLEDMDPQYPPAPDGLTDVEIV